MMLFVNSVLSLSEMAISDHVNASFMVEIIIVPIPIRIKTERNIPMNVWKFSSSRTSFLRRLKNFIILHHPFKYFLKVFASVFLLEFGGLSDDHKSALGDNADLCRNILYLKHIV